jgi:hypothetical protein
MDTTVSSQPPWLLLMHRLPPEPAYLRVKVRRRLLKVGALLVKNSVYVLPWSEEALEDLQWISREIRAEGGEAIVCEASFVGGVSNAELAAEFRQRVAEPTGDATGEEPLGTGRTWVTRRDVFVDRIASAWLIRRFIDPDATFRFVPSRGHVPGAGELRFDMFDGEYTHEGDACTFEVLARRFVPKDRAIRAIGELVHDIDCKDDKFGRPETAGIAGLMRGIARGTDDDVERIARGSAILDDLYTQFRGGKA